MRITGVRLDRLRLPLDPPFRAAWDPVPRDHVDATVVRVETDAGVVGVGSGDTMAGLDEAMFVGTDPLAIERHVRTIETANFHGARLWPLEAALWDVAGQVAGLPVATLLGGVATRVPAYASTGEVKEPEARVESTLAAREAGFRAVKVRIAPSQRATGLETVRRLREAVGPDFAIMVDLNQSWRMAGDIAPALDVSTVSGLVRELEELGVCWVEEPLPYADRRGLAALRTATRTRVAGGEMLPTFDDALALLDVDALDVYQPDVVLSLGISRVRTLAALARQRHRELTPHTWTNGIGLLANLHLAAGVGATPYLEVPYDPPGWTPERRDFMLAEPLALDPDGCLAVPDRPGLGIRLDEDAVARYRV